MSVLLTIGVIFVNGWTDAPNAIATCVSTRCMEVRAAILMAAVFNFFGVLVMSLVNSSVAMTIRNMVNFGGDNEKASIALCAAMAAIVIWAVGAWYFGIPTSESHALIAGLSGAAIALQGGIAGINLHEWVKVLYGLVLSTVLGLRRDTWSARQSRFVQEHRQEKDKCLFLGRTDCGRCSNGIYAWRTGRAEIHGGAVTGIVSCQWTGRYGRWQDSGLDDGTLFYCDGGRDFHRRQKNHQISGDGHGSSRKIPGIFGRHRGGSVSLMVNGLRDSREHDAYEDNCDYGRRSGETVICHQL